MSYITVSAEKVRSDALVAIEHINAERDRRNTAKIEKVIANHRIRFGFLWLKSRQRTVDEAIGFLENDPFGWRSRYHSYTTEPLLRKLLLLANNGDPVIIDEQAADALWSWHNVDD